MNKKILRASIRQELKETVREIVSLGGWHEFKSGEWLFCLIEGALRNNSESATSESLFAKYPNHSREQIAHKLIETASKKAALAGAITGAAVSADELVALFTAAEVGVGLPANIAIAATAICAEVFYTAKIQLELVTKLGILHATLLNPDDPEDILTIMNFAFGGGAAELAGHQGTQFSKALVGRYYARKESFEVLKRFARKLGYRLLRRSIANAVVPGVSMFVGAMWNKRTTRRVGKLVLRHFAHREELRAPMESNPD